MRRVTAVWIAGAAMMFSACGSDKPTATASVGSITLVNPKPTLQFGETTQLTAVVRATDGRVLSDRAVYWSSSNETTASVSGTGLVFAGPVRGSSAIVVVITARAEGKSVLTQIAIQPIGVASVEIVAPSLVMSAGDASQWTVNLKDALAGTLTGRVVTWSSSAPSVATVSAGGIVSALTPGTASITATAEGKSASAQISVQTAPNRDFAIAGAQITQGVQNSAGSVPIVLSGGAAAINVLVRATPSSTTRQRILLRLTNPDGSVVRTDTVLTNGTLLSNPSYDSPSAQFLIPASQLTAGLRWQVVRDPTHVAPDDSTQNDVFPRTGPTAINFRTVTPLSVRFVPIVLSAHGNIVGAVTQSNLSAYLRLTSSMLPIGALTASVGTPFTTAANFGTAPNGGAAAFWTQLLSELDLARVTDQTSPTTHWYGVVRPPSGFTYVANGGYSYAPSTYGTSSGTRTSVGVQVGWFTDTAFATSIVAHELGHTFGRRHAPCGGAESVDSNYPVSGGLIDAPGFNVFDWASGATSTAVVQPTSSGDIMGYCKPVWSSTYTYLGILNFRGSSQVAANRAANRVANQSASESTTPARERSLVVRGTVARDGTIALQPSYVLDAWNSAIAVRGTHVAEGRDAHGVVRFQQSFTPAAFDHTDDVQTFLLVVPESIAPIDSIASITIRSAQAVARIDARAPIASAVSAPSALRAQMVDGSAQYTCPEPYTAGIVLLDARSNSILGAANGATLRLASVPTNAVTRVCSDGVRSRRDVVAP